MNRTPLRSAFVWRSAVSTAWLLIAILLPALAAAGTIEVVLDTRKVDNSGGNLNRYSITDADGNGYGIYLNTSDRRITIERRDAWAGRRLATSSASVSGPVLGTWYRLSLVIEDSGGLTATASDPQGSFTPVTVTANDSRYVAFTQFNVNGGRVFDTDQVQVIANDRVVLDKDFNDGNLSDWFQLGSGLIELEDDDEGGYVLRKSGFNDPNGGSVDLRTLLTFDPTTDGILAIEDYATEYGVSFANAELVEDGAVFTDSRGVRNTNTAPSQTAVTTFADPVTAIDFRWVRFFEDATFVATAYEDEDRTIPVANIFLEACPFFDCSLTEDAGTETISASSIKALEFTGIRPGGSPDGPERSVGLDSLGFVTQPAPAP